jgi:hypothetical protein
LGIKTNFFAVKVACGKCKMSNQSEFLRTLAAISFYFEHVGRISPELNSKLFRQFCQLSALRDDHLTDKYFLYDDPDFLKIDCRYDLLFSMLLEVGNGSLELIRDACGPLEWRSQDLGIGAKNLLDWAIIEYFKNEVTSLLTFESFKISNIPVAEMISFLKFLYFHVNAFESWKPNLRTWDYVLETQPETYSLSVTSRILTGEKTRKQLKLTPHQSLFIEAILRGISSYEELEIHLRSSNSALRKLKAELSSRLKRVGFQDFIQISQPKKTTKGEFKVTTKINLV